ncbi:hypothetical protein ACP4OV_010096 [Aristida adscensionis]
MRLPIAGKKPSSLAAAAAAPDGTNNADGGAVLDTAGADGDGDGGTATDNGSKDESFFEARPWLDSDSEDDFQSVRGDFTPSRASTPVHQRKTSFTGRIPVDKQMPSVTVKKQRLIELLQEKQQFDDEYDSITDVGSDMENSSVHAEENLKASHKVKNMKKSSKSGCFPILGWKHSFKTSRK